MFFINGTHGLNCKNIVRNSSRNRKIDLPSIRHSFYKIIRVVSSNSDEENSFPRNIKKKTSLLLLTKTVSNTFKDLSFTLEYMSCFYMFENICPSSGVNYN